MSFFVILSKVWLELTRIEPITVSLASFYCLACAYFYKATVLQVMRQEKTKNYYFSGVTCSTLASLSQLF